MVEKGEDPLELFALEDADGAVFKSDPGRIAARLITYFNDVIHINRHQLLGGYQGAGHLSETGAILSLEPARGP